MYIIRQDPHSVNHIWLYTQSLAAGPPTIFLLTAARNLSRFAESASIIAAITEERNPTLQMNARPLSRYGLTVASCSRTQVEVLS